MKIYPYTCYCCPVSAAFTVIKRDRISGTPIARAVYGLYQNGELTARGASDLAGDLTFIGLAAGCYELREITPPPGYQADAGSISVVVDRKGHVTIDGRPAAEYTLYAIPLSVLMFQKLDSCAGIPVPGAVFALSNGQRTLSDSQGFVNFGILDAGIYTMTEEAVPAGYMAASHIYTVAVALTGGITIDGRELSDFNVQSNPCSSLSFYIFDAVTHIPLANAGFSVSNGERAISDANGFVRFNPLAPGTYALTEYAAPAGYLSLEISLTVSVETNGTILVNDIPMTAFSLSNMPISASVSPTENRYCKSHGKLS